MHRLTLALSLAATVCLALFAQPASAQFFNFFGNQGGGQPREEEAPPRGDASWFEARTEASTCPHYLCPRTLSCVLMPSQCPCAFPQQRRCPYPDPVTGKLEEGGVFCVQEGSGGDASAGAGADDSCDRVLKARGAWWDWQKVEGITLS